MLISVAVGIAGSCHCCCFSKPLFHASDVAVAVAALAATAAAVVVLYCCC